MMTAGAILDEVAERFLGKVPFRETKYLGRITCFNNHLFMKGKPRRERLTAVLSITSPLSVKAR